MALKILRLISAALLAILVWSLLHLFQGGWAYLVYLITFPVVRVLAWNYTVEGLALLGCMVVYAMMMELLLRFFRSNTARLIVVSAYAGLVVLVLVKEWPYWMPW